jgi:hypothetical protein
MKTFDRALAAAGAVLVGAVVVTELRKPAAERTWQGRLAGVPYDLRPPTLHRLRARLWDPDNPALLVPHAFGIGWTINVARLVQLVSPGRRGASAGGPPR